MTAVADLPQEGAGADPPIRPSQQDGELVGRASDARGGPPSRSVASGSLYLLPNLTIPLVDTPTPTGRACSSRRSRSTCSWRIGLNIVVGYAGLLDLGYVAFFAIGAYTIGVLTLGSRAASASGPRSRSRIALAMLAGLLLGTPTLRLRGDYLAIVTLGFGEIIRITARNSNWLGGPRGISQHPPAARHRAPALHGLLDAKPYYYLALDVHHRSSS